MSGVRDFFLCIVLGGIIGSFIGHMTWSADNVVITKNDGTTITCESIENRAIVSSNDIVCHTDTGKYYFNTSNIQQIYVEGK